MKHIIIEPSGRTIIRSFTDIEVNLNRDMAQAMADGQSISVLNVGTLREYGESMRVHAGFSTAGNQVWVIMLKSIRFLAGLRSREGVVTLNFEGTDKVELIWKPPTDLRLLLAIDMYQDRGQIGCEKAYLMAIDAGGRCYRLPIANVFDDTSLCTGDYARMSKTSIGVVKLTYRQFREAPWNADLFASKSDAFKIMTDKMFRWKTEDSGFTQVPMQGEAWQDLCIQVSNGMTERVNEVVGEWIYDGAPMPAIEDEDEDEEGDDEP